MTQKEKVILAAAKFASEFSFGEIVIDAWKSDKMEFGLAPEPMLYPDSKKIASVIMGNRGLVQSGDFIILEPGVYMLSAKHKNLIASNMGFKDDDNVDGLRKLRDTAAYKKYENNRPGKATLSDAYAYFTVAGSLGLFDKKTQKTMRERVQTMMANLKRDDLASVRHIRHFTDFLWTKFGEDMNLDQSPARSLESRAEDRSYSSTLR